MGKVLPYHLFLCTIFFLFKLALASHVPNRTVTPDAMLFVTLTVCLGTTCYGYDLYGYYTYLTCSYGCCGTTSYQYCCYSSSWTSWSSWSAVTTATSGVSIGLIVGCSIAGIAVLASIVGGIVFVVYKVNHTSRVVRVNPANIAHTNTSGQHPTNTMQNPPYSINTSPPNLAGPSQMPPNYMYPPPSYPNEVPPSVNVPQQPFNSGNKM